MRDFLKCPHCERDGLDSTDFYWYARFGFTKPGRSAWCRPCTDNVPPVARNPVGTRESGDTKGLLGTVLELLRAVP